VTISAVQARAFEAPVASKKWIDILDQTVVRNHGKLPIDPKLSVVVDTTGDCSQLLMPSTAEPKDRHAQYIDAFIKLRSLVTLGLYGTPEGREAYLEVFNPEFLQRVADRLSFADPNGRNNLKNQRFTPQQLPELLNYIHHNMTFTLSMWEFFTKTFNFHASEEDTKFYNPAPGRNGLFKFVNGQPNGQTVRVAFSEKLGQLALLTTWLIEGNPALGIPALGVKHPVVIGLLVYHMQAAEHDCFHGLQYLFKPVPFLITLLQGEELKHFWDPNNPNYGLVPRGMIQLARNKLINEREGFYISGFFRRGNEKQIVRTSNFLEDLRHSKSTLRGLGRADWSPRLADDFKPGGDLEWLQMFPGSLRDIVNVVMRGDMANPARNLWRLDDAHVFPDSMENYMDVQFDPAEIVWEMRDLPPRPSAADCARVQAKWDAVIGVAQRSGALKDYTNEFTYLQPIIGRYDREVRKCQ
jgi:hypothetical protein